MAFTTMWQWSTTAASNTEIDGITLSNSMTPTQIDDSIRELMSQVATSTRKGSAVASAGTVTLGDGTFFHITGNTGPITDIDFTDAADGRWAILEFDSTPTITHNATTLNLPGGADIVVAAGDRALIVQDSSDNVRVLFYERASVAPLVTSTFTPTLTFGGAAVGMTGTFEGKYTKSGNVVHFNIYINLTDSGTSTGSALIGGLPFTSANSANLYSPCAVFAQLLPAGVTTALMAIVQPNATTILPYRFAAGAATQLTEGSFDDDSQIVIQGSYFTA